MGRDEGREDVVAAVARGAVAVLPAVVGGEQGAQRGQEVVVAAGARFEDRDAGGGVWDEEVEEAVLACRLLRQEGRDLTGEVEDPLLSAGVHIEDTGAEALSHDSILAQELPRRGPGRGRRGKIRGARIVGVVVREDTAVREVEVVVVGAGQAGLSAAFHLRRTGFTPGEDFVVLDHTPGPGGAWQFRWPSLTYGKVHGMHSLPGMELTDADPGRPSSEVVSAYFRSYEETFGLRVRRPVDVRAVREGPDGRLRVETSDGVWLTRALISATGTWDRPFWPRYPGQETFRGRQLHTAGYRGPEEFAGQRVVVVGGGASGTQHLLELAPLAAATTWVTRRAPVFREGPFGEEEGRTAVALVEERVRRGLPPRSVVSVTGLPLNDAIRAGLADGTLDRQPMFDRIVPEGVVWDGKGDGNGDGDVKPGGSEGRLVEADVLLWATGFRPAVEHLAPLRLREPGGGIRVEETRVALDPRIHLVGYGPSASTIGANRAGRTAVRDIRRLLHDQDLGQGAAQGPGRQREGHEAVPVATAG